MVIVEVAGGHLAFRVEFQCAIWNVTLSQDNDERPEWHFEVQPRGSVRISA